MVQTSLLQVVDSLGAALELQLEKGSGSGEHRGVIARRQIQVQPGETFAEGEMFGKLSGVNYFFALTTTISPYRRQLLFDS
jgi:hypothetical protein